MRRLRTKERFHWRILTSVVALAGLATTSKVADDRASQSTSIGEFCRLSPDGQKSLLKSAFEARLRLAKNIHYEVLMRGQTYKYDDGKIGPLTGNLIGSRYRHWRL